MKPTKTNTGNTINKLRHRERRKNSPNVSPLFYATRLANDSTESNGLTFGQFSSSRSFPVTVNGQRSKPR